MNKYIFLCLALFLFTCVGCGSSGGSNSTSFVSSPGATQPVQYSTASSPFADHGFSFSGHFCNYTGGNPKWTCTSTSKPASCPTTLPPDLQIWSNDTAALWAPDDVQSVTYSNGQFVMGDGFTFSLVWQTTNTYDEQVSNSSVVASFGTCSVLYW